MGNDAQRAGGAVRSELRQLAVREARALPQALERRRHQAGCSARSRRDIWRHVVCGSGSSEARPLCAAAAGTVFGRVRLPWAKLKLVDGYLLLAACRDGERQGDSVAAGDVGAKGTVLAGLRGAEWGPDGERLGALGSTNEWVAGAGACACHVA